MFSGVVFAYDINASVCLRQFSASVRVNKTTDFPFSVRLLLYSHHEVDTQWFLWVTLNLAHTSVRDVFPFEVSLRRRGECFEGQ